MEIFIFLGLVVIVSTIFIIFKVRQSKYIRYLLNNSFTLNKLLKLNDNFKFVNISNDYFETHTYDNEIFFNNISCEDYLIYQLQFKKFEIEKAIKSIKYNITLYEKYINELTKISDFGKYKNEEKLNVAYRLKLEKKLFEQKVLNPKRVLYIQIVLYCSKINGDIYAKKQQIFTTEEVATLIKRLSNKNYEFYNDKGIWDALCRVERGRVSNKMRFAIYKRDGYRCCYCGRSEDADYLEIDHIKPIAKGGKSTYDNLQTLCRRCNKNKGDSY